MSAALIPSFFVLLLVAFATAEPQMKVVGEGLMSNPVTSNAPGNGMRYAGPIVYTNEKPPIIFFPPPPKDAKPGQFYPSSGLNFGQGISFFGKSKSPKSIKYVPMPHHDLPVLIYTSDKTPPIHVVQPPHSVSGGPPQGPSSFGPPKDDFGPPPGSLSSTYRGILPEASSARVVTSSYEIPSTSYGTPMRAPFGGSLDSQSASSSEGNSQQQHSSISFGQQTGSGGQSNKKPPHIMYSGHPPIHVFNQQPDTFVRAPKEIPLKYYEELPPKASFGPPKSSFGPPSGNAFGAPPRHHRRPHPAASPFGSPQRPGSSYQEENLIFAGSSNNPTSAHPPQNNQAPIQPSISYGSGSPPVGSPTYSFAPQQSEYSFGPFSVEYGPPSEPFMSFSEPSGSLSSFYGEANAENGNNGNVGSGAGGQDGWMPGPPPTDIAEGHMKENEWNGPPQQAHSPSHYNGPSPMHSVFLPSSNSRPHPPHHHHPLPYGGSKLANLFSNFKLKRSKPKYAIAPKSMHKPPIIIYYGKKPPVHVYQKPETEEATITAGSSPSISVTSAESGRNVMASDNGNGNKAQSSSSFDNVDLTYGASQNTEVRVAAPAISSISSDSQNMRDRKPAIIQAKPVDIFSSSSELQPSIYMARNSLNTIFVSDLSGSGTKALKTFIVRRSEDASRNPGRLSVAEATVYTPLAQQQQAGSIIMSNIAQNRISGEQILTLTQPQEHQHEEQQELIQVPISAPETVDLEQLPQQEEEEVEDNVEESSNNIPSTTILVVPSKTGEEIENENRNTEAKEQSAESRNIQIIQSPSSFQTSLSQAEKEAEEAQAESSS